MNSNGSTLCDVSIGSEAVQTLDADIETAYHNIVNDGGLMESADLGFGFHYNFLPVGLSAGYAAASSATDESIALVECLSVTLNKLIANADAFAEANKSDLEM